MGGTLTARANLIQCLSIKSGVDVKIEIPVVMSELRVLDACHGVPKLVPGRYRRLEVICCNSLDLLAKLNPTLSVSA
jgi:hypothetical protein